MSEENVELVRRGWEDLERGDIAAAFKFVHPEVVSYTAPPLPDPAEYHGLDGMLEWLGNWIEGFDDYVQHAEEYIEAGDHVIARVHQRGTGTESGVPVEGEFWFLHRLRNGKLVRMGVHVSKQQALEAAGLQE
jgi:ketosteroid isomerase-like protein